MNVLDLFAGAGGFSLGFSMAGFDVIGAIERDKWAADTFCYNHPKTKMLVGDIRSFSEDEIYESFSPLKPQVIIGGPPCQGFSICTKNAGDPKDPRNSLFMEFLRVVRLFKPSFIVMENVPNLMKAYTLSKKRVIDIIVKELELLGYVTHVSILEAYKFGVPQLRKRLFIVGSKHPLDNPFPSQTHFFYEGKEQLSLEENLIRCPTLWEAISDLPEIAAREGSEETDYSKPAVNQYQELMRLGSNKVYNHKAMNHSKRMVERFHSMKWGDSIKNVPDNLKPYKRNGNGQLSAKIYDQNNRRIHPNKLCHTIPASFYANFVHPFSDRNFTAREGARIQSFPDWYVFKGKPTVVSHKLLSRENRLDEKYLCQYNQIGNAVPPLLAKAIAQNLLMLKR